MGRSAAAIRFRRACVAAFADHKFDPSTPHGSGSAAAIRFFLPLSLTTSSIPSTHTGLLRCGNSLLPAAFAEHKFDPPTHMGRSAAALRFFLPLSLSTSSIP
jgi:hypothetical protein